mgnify:CR=1 FL=1
MTHTDSIDDDGPRQLVCALLLQAINDAREGDHNARAWLRSPRAESWIDLLDIGIVLADLEQVIGKGNELEIQGARDRVRRVGGPQQLMNRGQMSADARRLQAQRLANLVRSVPGGSQSQDLGLAM